MGRNTLQEGSGAVGGRRLDGIKGLEERRRLRIRWNQSWRIAE
jgi:hypothetical protein